MPSFRGSSQFRDRTQGSCIAGNSLPSEPLGKPKNTRVWVAYPFSRVSSLDCNFLVLDSSGFGVRIMLASQKEFRSFSSSATFLE